MRQCYKDSWVPDLGAPQVYFSRQKYTARTVMSIFSLYLKAATILSASAFATLKMTKWKNDILNLSKVVERAIAQGLTKRPAIAYTLVNMSYAVITTKIDPQTKKAAMDLAEELGMPLSVIIKAFLKQFIRTKSIEINARDEEPSEYLKLVMKQAEENWEKGNHSPAFRTGKSAVVWLEKQGI